MKQYQELVNQILEQPYTMAFCYHCGVQNQNIEDNYVCSNCGKDISVIIEEYNDLPKYYCHNCGEKLIESKDFCISCGKNKKLHQFDLILMALKYLDDEENITDALKIGEIAFDYSGSPDMKFIGADYIRGIYADLLKEKFDSNAIQSLSYEVLKDNLFKNILKYSQIAVNSFDKIPSVHKQFLLKKFEYFSSKYQDLKAVCYEIPIEMAKRGLIENSSIQNTNNHKKQTAGCFIATAVYDTYEAPEVLILRKFRDDILLTSNIGKIFVKFYYFFSPQMARLLSKQSKLKVIVREKFLTPFVKYVEQKYTNKQKV